MGKSQTPPPQAALGGARHTALQLGDSWVSYGSWVGLSPPPQPCAYTQAERWGQRHKSSLKSGTEEVLWPCLRADVEPLGQWLHEHLGQPVPLSPQNHQLSFKGNIPASNKPPNSTGPSWLLLPTTFQTFCTCCPGYPCQLPPQACTHHSPTHSLWHVPQGSEHRMERPSQPQPGPCSQPSSPALLACVASTLSHTLAAFLGTACPQWEVSGAWPQGGGTWYTDDPTPSHSGLRAGTSNPPQFFALWV